MNKLAQHALAGIALCLAALGAQAQGHGPVAGTATPGIDARQAHQQQRIAQGVASGSLTPREARHLQHQQRHIARVEGRAKADGVVTRHERHHLRHLQRHASHRIHQQKHDRQVRHGH